MAIGEGCHLSTYGFASLTAMLQVDTADNYRRQP